LVGTWRGRGDGLARASTRDSRGISLGSWAAALDAAGGTAWFLGDRERAERLFEEGLAIYRDLGDRAGIARILARLGPPLTESGRVDEAERLLEEAVRINRELGETNELALSLSLLGGAVFMRGDLQRADELIRESAGLTRETGDLWQLAWDLHNLADLALRRDDPDAAWSTGCEALATAREIGDDLAVLISLGVLAIAAKKRGHARQAGLLWGSAERLDHELGENLWREPESAAEREELLAERDREFELGVEEGRALPLDRAVALALEP
jgi:tetratricopeptide (TPR) repeat protein